MLASLVRPTSFMSDLSLAMTRHLSAAAMLWECLPTGSWTEREVRLEKLHL
jgi:hypothetical protein